MRRRWKRNQKTEWQWQRQRMNERSNNRPTRRTSCPTQNIVIIKFIFKKAPTKWRKRWILRMCKSRIVHCWHFHSVFFLFLLFRSSLSSFLLLFVFLFLSQFLYFHFILLWTLLVRLSSVEEYGIPFPWAAVAAAVWKLFYSIGRSSENFSTGVRFLCAACYSVCQRLWVCVLVAVLTLSILWFFVSVAHSHSSHPFFANSFSSFAFCIFSFFPFLLIPLLSG